MNTTRFKPSIHGWPFPNSFTYTVNFELVNQSISKQMGFCGGMCWLALQMFYNAVFASRTLTAPQQGDPLYDDILHMQIESLPFSTILKIYGWQCRPNLSHSLRSHSLGYETKQEWPGIRSRIDNGEPVTLTIIEHSNDGNPAALSDNHRVVAYAYDERHLYDGEWVHGGRNSNIRVVTIYIYDPNEPNDDDVQLTFYTNCDDNWLGLRHNRGASAHGFFLDDKNRSYASSSTTQIELVECSQTGISSGTHADYKLTFSWQCRFIPYYRIFVDGITWKHNDVLKQTVQPLLLDDKQCPAKSGNMALDIKLPRTQCKVTVRLLDSDAYTDSLDVDVKPGIACNPYVQHRALGDEPEICDSAIQDTDLFIKVADPSDAEVQALDTSPMRWVFLRLKPPTDTRTSHDDMTRATLEVFRKYRLGNIKVPVFADFVLRNLAAPVTLFANVTNFKGGSVVGGPTRLNVVNTSAQKLFDGFTNNPSDYDDDIVVNVDYVARDKYDVQALGMVSFYGQSIIFEQGAIIISVFDPARYARAAAVARYLIEIGLIETAITLPPPRPFPPGPLDPSSLIKRLRAHQDLPKLIDQKLKTVLGDPATWKNVWKAQSELLKRANPTELLFDAGAKAGDVLKATKVASNADARIYEPLVIDTIANRAIDELRGDPDVVSKLGKL